MELPGVGSQLLQQLTASGKLVLHILAGEELDPVGVVVLSLIHI